jgi:hypothetical protein
MKNYYKFLYLLAIISLNSCKSIVANQGKQLNDSSLVLNEEYEIQDYNAEVHKLKINCIDNNNIYGITKKGDVISIDKKEIREVKKVKIGSSIIVGILAIAAIILVPI